MGKFFGIILAIIFGLFLLGKCVGGNDDTYDVEAEMAAIRAEEGFDSPKLSPTTEGFSISSPSDPGASYRILKISRMKNSNLEVLSRRDGSSGTSFARREINCSAYTYRYLGEGDSLAEAEKNGPNPGTMSELTGASASSDVADAACKRGVK
jgi:hypothetical protein